MDAVKLQDFKTTQKGLLVDIGKHLGSCNLDLVNVCKQFLCNQREHLTYLGTMRKIHMIERGKLTYHLMSEEEMPLSVLKEAYAVFAKVLDEFINYLTKPWHSQAKPYFNGMKATAVNIAKDMLEICTVLEMQPSSVSYARKKIEAPNLLLLGAHCLSDLEISNCQFTAVSNSELQSASRNNLPLDGVSTFKGFELKEETTSQTSKNTVKCHDCICKNLGSWTLDKDKMVTPDKGSAHKDFVRLRYTLTVKFYNSEVNLMLLSLPFTCRKGSCQVYTFNGALMWYYYTVPDPYKNFEVTSSLPIPKVHDMIIKRLEIIGRSLTPRAKTFFMDRLNNLFPRGTVELETLAKGPPSNIDDKAQLSSTTPTVDQTIETFGFFTWFYALVNCLEKGGYMNNLWLDGYIYDICEIEHVHSIVKSTSFGAKMLILRPSMSAIFNCKGSDINMELALFFKKADKPNKVFNVRTSKQRFIQYGVYKLITLLMPLEYVYTSNGGCFPLEKLKSISDTPAEGSYHNTKYNIECGLQIQEDDPEPKQCCCSCHDDEEFGTERGGKKARNISGNSDDHVSELRTNSMRHKRQHDSAMVSPAWSIESNDANAVLNGVGVFQNPKSSMTPSRHSNSLDFPYGSPDSGMVPSPGGKDLPDFHLILSPGPVSTPTTTTSLTSREELIADFQDAFKKFSSSCSNNDILHLTNYTRNMTVIPSGQEVLQDIVDEDGTMFTNLQPGLNIISDLFNQEQSGNDLQCINWRDINTDFKGISEIVSSTSEQPANLNNYNY